jgi:uncharacterized membrane protein
MQNLHHLPVHSFMFNQVFRFSEKIYFIHYSVLGVIVLMSFSTIFQLHHGGQFYWW